MSKLYTNQSAGTSVLTGSVKTISQDRKSVMVAYNQYDYQSKKSTPKEKNIILDSPLDASYAQNQTITAVGYIMGPDFKAISVSNKENVYETDTIAFLSGHVASVKMKEEKNEDGSSKLTREGKPKKPHLDITLDIPRADGQVVHHIVKVYDVPNTTDAMGNIEKYSKRFADFVNPQDTPIYATIATKPGQEFSIPQDGGGVYLGVSHLGINSLDLEFQFQRVKNQQQNAPRQQDSDMSQQAAPSVPAAPQPQPQTPAGEVNGFEVDYNFEEEFEQ